ncbi:MAG: hypothetical protein Q7S33_01515 [Nanoarchaeota archaeon]|nr:hypothetical protein [Nanoarchaeota archaeon]
MHKKSQQEIIGFVLIVVLVIVAGFVFLLISLQTPAAEINSAKINDLIYSTLKYTSKCAISSEPNYDSIEELINSCADNEKCSNLDIVACDYLNQSLTEIIPELIKLESPPVSAYQLKIYRQNSNDNMFNLKQGDCKGNVYGSQRSISKYPDNIVVNLRLCY